MMNVQLKIALSLLVVAGFSASAHSAPPPPLKPAELLSSGGSQPLKPEAKAVKTPSKPAAPKRAVKPASKSSSRPVARKPVVKPVSPKAEASQDSTKLDRAAVIFKKCVEIEKLAKRKSAVKCLDRFLDRLDIEVGNVEVRIMNCGESRRLENLEQGERVRSLVVGKMTELRQANDAAVDQAVRDEERAGRTVGPRKMKEFELRALEAQGHQARKLADLVCSKQAFAMLLERSN